MTHFRSTRRSAAVRDADAGSAAEAVTGLAAAVARTSEARDLEAWLDQSYAKAYRTAVLICGNPDDAREAVQDAFLRTWRFRDSLPADATTDVVVASASGAGTGSLAGSGESGAVVIVKGGARNSREAWMYRVLVNACYSKLRREIPRRERELGDDEGLARRTSTEPQPEAFAENVMLNNVMVNALQTLPETLRVPVVLRYWTGYSEAEIALAIGKRPGTVKSRLHEARRRLATDPALVGFAAEMFGGAP